MHVIFSRPRGEQKKKGPYECLRFEGELVRATRDGAVIARHVDHQWVVDGENFSRLDFEGRVKVQFCRVDKTVSQSYGPFESFSCVDGIAYRERSVFAFVDRSVGDWYCHDDGHHWPLMVVEPA